MIVTYTALIALAILRDDFTRLDRQGLVMFLKPSQKEDGRFVPTSTRVCWANRVRSFTSDPMGGVQIYIRRIVPSLYAPC